jgi:hypothetical protein
MTVMYKFFLRTFYVVFATLGSIAGYAQTTPQTEKPQMAELMRSNGKIYVVVAVLLIILAGLFTYLMNTDRKLTRLEKNIKL